MSDGGRPLSRRGAEAQSGISARIGSLSVQFWRDSSRNEIDVVYETPEGLQPVEIKSGSTFAADWLAGLKTWQKFSADTPGRKPILTYGGTDSHEREACCLTGWRNVVKG